MGKGFSLKGRTGVKECLAFQTPNPFPAVWNAGLHCSTHPSPHEQKHTPLEYAVPKTNLHLLRPHRHPICLEQRKRGL